MSFIKATLDVSLPASAVQCTWRVGGCWWSQVVLVTHCTDLPAYYILSVCFLPLIAVRPKWHYNMQKRPCWRWLCTVCSKQEHAVQWPVLGRTLQCTFALCLTFWASSLTKWILVPRPAACCPRYSTHNYSITTISYELKMCRYFPVWARRARQYSTPLSVSLSG